MDEQLYLFEALIESIYFEDSVTEIPQKKQIVVSVKLGDVVTLEIRSETLPQTGEGPRKRHVDFRSGKSYLCMLTVEKLLETFQKHPLDIAVGIRGDVKPIGSSNTPWDDSFKEMVLLTKDNTEFVSPTTIIDNYCLLENGMIKGNVQMLLRISCFGKSIQTHFEVLQESMNKQFLFKISNMGTTFACSRYGTGTSNDFIPVSAIYNSINFKSDQEKPTGAKPLSWTALMEDRKIRSERSSVQSEFLFPEYLNIIAPLRESAMTFDIISIQMRPEEDRFIDFMTGKKLGEKNDSLHSLSLYGWTETLKENWMAKLSEKLKKIYIDEKNVLQTNKQNRYLERILHQTLDMPRPTNMKRNKLMEFGQLIRLRAGAITKSPIAECQELMNQFDKILEEYKKALSPCGEISCNYSPNIAETLCKSTCKSKNDLGRFYDGCGSPQCHYAKYKSTLMPEDLDVETQFVGPAIIGNCGHPKCSYLPEPVLNPIHWDCPDPLPTGKCKNPNCPYTSNQKQFGTKGPCGSYQCPYLPPAPCGSLGCPFKSLPTCSCKTGTPKNKNIPNSTKCPFENVPPVINRIEMMCNNPDCENINKEEASGRNPVSNICNSPNCPYIDMKKDSKCLKKKSEGCSNPDCPLRSVKQSEQSCANPDCPFKARKSTQSCSNPDCPLKKNKQSSRESCNRSIKASISTILSTCFNAECPFKKKSKEIEQEEEIPKPCENPECPFNIPSVESCKNPECPFKNEVVEEESYESCDNPECPFNKSSKESSGDSICECSNPTCPGKRETCVNPNCLFNLRGYEPCTNVECPHKKYAFGKDLGFCATPDPSFNEYCMDKTCKYHDPKLDQEGDARDDIGPGKSMLKTGDPFFKEGTLEFTKAIRTSTYDMAPCTIKTCKFMGGKLECVDCGVGTDQRKRGPCPKTCPGDPICPLATIRKQKKVIKRQEPCFKRTCSKPKHARSGYKKYPGYKIGHRDCVMPFFYVPKTMGWLWNIHTPCLNLKPRRGWKPGAVTVSVAKAIQEHRKQLKPKEEIKKKIKVKSQYSDADMICPKPTLEIKKREGIYHIVMNPLKDPNSLAMNENPYLDCTPMKFQVAKNNIYDPQCVCTDDGEFYKCDSSSDDELDIEVTTPAGIIHLDRPLQKKNDMTKQTQYDPRDIVLPKGAKGEETKKGKRKGKK